MIVYKASWGVYIFLKFSYLARGTEKCVLSGKDLPGDCDKILISVCKLQTTALNKVVCDLRRL